MKTLSVLFIAAAIPGWLVTATPAAAADLPVTRPAYRYIAPAYVATPGCHLGLERFWDGSAWRSRNVQVVN